jgi:hypothetical protein
VVTDMWIHGPHVSEGTRITGQSVVCSHQLRGRRCSAPQSMTFLAREKNTHRICGSRRVRGLFGSPPHFDTAKFVAATKEKATALFRLNLRLLQLLQVFFSPKVWHQKRMPHFVAASSAWQPVTANQTSPRSEASNNLFLCGCHKLWRGKMWREPNTHEITNSGWRSWPVKVRAIIVISPAVTCTSCVLLTVTYFY